MVWLYRRVIEFLGRLMSKEYQSVADIGDALHLPTLLSRVHAVYCMDKCDAEAVVLKLISFLVSLVVRVAFHRSGSDPFIDAIQVLTGAALSKVFSETGFRNWLSEGCDGSSSFMGCPATGVNVSSENAAA